MKCDAAVMRCTTGRPRASVNRNHAGIFRSRNVTVPGATRWTFVGEVQYGRVTSSGVWPVAIHRARSFARSQRREPITTADAPPRVWYARRFGATTVKRVVAAFVGVDASVSSKTIVRELR